jgi:phosphatidylinositol glycan class S
MQMVELLPDSDRTNVQVETLPNLEMPLSIGKKVDGAREHMQAAMIAASELDYARALHEAREARTCAEVAATHHTIVSQHSYPEQHKVALYLPFFGPISMPLISALIYEVKRTMRLWS